MSAPLPVPPLLSRTYEGPALGSFEQPAPAPAPVLSVPVGLIRLDGAGRILDFTDTQERPGPLRREQLLGRNFFDLAPWACDLERRFLEIARSPGRVCVQTFCCVLHLPDGRLRQVSIVVTSARSCGQYYLSLLYQDAPQH